MKLLYITNGINGAGGLERVLSVKASYLAENYDYELHILVLNEADKNPFYEFNPKIQLYSISVKGSINAYLKAYKTGIQKICNRIQPDIISVCDDGLKGFFLPKLIKTKAKWIYERHVSKLIEKKSEQGFVKNLLTKTKWTLMGYLAKGFSKFVVLTEGNRKEWRNLKNLVVIPNPLSFYPEESSALNQKTVICVGKISYQKGQDLLVKAWEYVYQKHPDWKLELYGKSNENFLTLRALDSQNIVHYEPEKNIQEKYLNSSLCVMSSRFEGFGMVLVEAMACGVPCVSFNCDYGPADIIRNNEDGLLAKKENMEDLAEKINILIENQDLRQQFGSKAKINVQRFELKIIGKQWDVLFKTLYLST